MWCLKLVHVLCECSESTYGFFYSRDICCLEFIVETNQVWQLMTMLRQILHSIHHTVIIRNEIRIWIDQKIVKMENEILAFSFVVVVLWEWKSHYHHVVMIGKNMFIQYLRKWTNENKLFCSQWRRLLSWSIYSYIHLFSAQQHE